jgi:uncharacterized membrane protein YeiH
MLKVPIAIELTGIVMGSLSGGVHAAERRADIIGIFILACATALGGGILRDILMGVGTPGALVHPVYLLVVGGASLVTLLLAPHLARVAKLRARVDALLVGVWTVMGTEQALAHSLPMTSAVFLGTLTATGGGMLRDVLTGQMPAMMTKGELLATAAFLGATLDVFLLRGLRLRPFVGELTTIGVTAALRLAALRWHLTAPAPDDVARFLRHPGSRDAG